MMTFQQLYDGYSKSLNNAERLLSAGLKLFGEYSEIALGLFELGQEELGKSFTFLAAFIFSDTLVVEEFLFKDWKNHRVKVHRAFLYELISLLRVVIENDKGNILSGGSVREKLHYEKEASFYVNYDGKQKKFISPQEDIQSVEVGNRGGTLLCLLNTALCVKKVLDDGERKKTNYKLFSDLAQSLLCLEIYQQDMPAVFESFAKQSPKHARIVDNLAKVLPKSGE
jgi:AbiV family abortive infection protein